MVIQATTHLKNVCMSIINIQTLYSHRQSIIDILSIRDILRPDQLKPKCI